MPPERRKHPDETWRPYAQALGHRIVELRKKRRLSQLQLANLSGVSSTYLEATELGQLRTGKVDPGTANPTLDVLWALAAALDVTVVELLDDLGPSPRTLSRSAHQQLR